MTPPDIGVTMTTAEIESLLASNGHGVLSLANDNRAYGIPISFAYDAAKSRIILEFVTNEDSKKASFLETTTEATLTVHTFETAEAWESVIVTGPLEELRDTDVADRAAAQFFAQADDAAADTRWRDDADIDRSWFTLCPSDMSGRHGGILPHQHARGLVRYSDYDRTY